MYVTNTQNKEDQMLYALADNTNREMNNLSISPIHTQNYGTCLPRVRDLSDHHHVDRSHFALAETSHACFAYPFRHRCRPSYSQQVVTHTYSGRTITQLQTTTFIFYTISLSLHITET